MYTYLLTTSASDQVQTVKERCIW